MECNKKPPIDTFDEGVTRRIAVLEFKSKFVNDPQKVNPDENIYPMDHKLGRADVQEQYGKILLNMLLTRHNALRQSGNHLFVAPTPAIVQSSKSYYTDTNIFINFLDDNLKKTNDRADGISMQDLYVAFAESHEYRNLHSSKRPSKKDCMEILKNSSYYAYYHCDDNPNITSRHPGTKNKNVLGKHVFT